jgi:hypothetical protein
VKRERLAFLADNPFYTQRFAYYVGRRCRSATIKDIAEELRLDWDAVKELDKQYMRAQLKRAGTPGPQAIGIDEISIRKGHTYRIVVSDLIRRRPMWFGGQDRSEASMDKFYRFLGEKKAKKIRLAEWTCGGRLEPRPVATLRRRPSCSTNSTFFATSARLSTPYASANTAGSRANRVLS